MCGGNKISYASTFPLSPFPHLCAELIYKIPYASTLVTSTTKPIV